MTKSSRSPPPTGCASNTNVVLVEPTPIGAPMRGRSQLRPSARFVVVGGEAVHVDRALAAVASVVEQQLAALADGCGRGRDEGVRRLVELDTDADLDEEGAGGRGDGSRWRQGVVGARWSQAAARMAVGSRAPGRG